jgi:hypothetical protein
MNILTSYEKASQDILQYLKQDPTIFLIQAMLFRVVAAAASHSNLHSFNYRTYDHLSIIEIIPSIYRELEQALPYPDTPNSNHFITELVVGYGTSWIPIVDSSYQHAINTNFRDDLDMSFWQRYLRSEKSNDKIELTILSIDPNQTVREKATSRLKTFDIL